MLAATTKARAKLGATGKEMENKAACPHTAVYIHGTRPPQVLPAVLGAVPWGPGQRDNVKRVAESFTAGP